MSQSVKEGTVLKIEKTNDKPGAWVKLRVLGDDGKERDCYLKDAVLIAAVNQTGVYKFTKEKKGQYWEIVGARFLRPLNGNGNGNGAVASAPAASPAEKTAYTRTPGQVDPNTLLQNKCITAQVAIKAAAEVIGHALANGAFKTPATDKTPEKVDISEMSNTSAVIASMFMDEARKFVTGKPETANGQAAAHPEGA